MAVNEFDEFRKQYEKTFIRIKFENTNVYKVVNILACISDDEKNPYFVIHNPEIGQCAIKWNDTRQSLDYSFPKVGLFNHKHGFLLFHRFPERQWKRGITSANSHIGNPLWSIYTRIPDYRRLNFEFPSITYSVLESAFHGYYPTNIDDAIYEIESESICGVCINGTFGITKNPMLQKEYLFWKSLSIIGTVDVRTRTIEVIEPVFRQEVQDFLKRKQEFDWKLR